MNGRPKSRRDSGFSTVELVGAVLIFSAATSGALHLAKAMRDHRVAAISASEQNAYGTFQSQVALQGIDPSLVANPMAAALGASAGAHVSAVFEASAVANPDASSSALPGSVKIDAVAYRIASAGNQASRGQGMGFGIETGGVAAPAAPNAIQLAPPVFAICGDLSQAAFPLGAVAVLPSSNPAGTVYRYTTDGSAPTGTSPVWDNAPDWTPETFPAQVSLAAFNPDPQYSQSPAVTATYTFSLSLSLSRADGRAANLTGFTLPELSEPSSSGIVLSANLSEATILATLDGTDPNVSSTAFTYAGPFAPSAAQFGPTVTLKAVAVSADQRFSAGSVQTYVLSADALTLTPPSFVTDNSQPLSPGTSVVIDAGGSGGSPRTEVNNGTPTLSSSSSTSFPLD